MSQCIQRKYRIAIAAVYSVLLMVSLFGCSMTELEQIAQENKLEEINPTLGEGKASKSKNKHLSFHSSIKGGKQPSGGTLGAFRRLLVGPGDEIRFVSPVAVGGVDNYLFIVDAGQRVVFRYDLVTQEIEPIGDIGFHFSGDPGNIYVAKDRTFYIVDSVGKQVHRFDERGNLLQTFADLANLSRPIDVFVNELTEEVYVADGSFSHVVVFNKFGKALRAVGKRGTGPGRFRAITAIAKGPDGIYVVDRLELPVQVISMEGQYKYSFGESYQVFPTAVAVTEDRVAFVADKSDNTIRIYQDAELLAVVGGTGSAPGRFRSPSSLWINNGLLYVADSMNKRIQVMRIGDEPAVPAALTL
jgi:hypothetical protein